MLVEVCNTLPFVFLIGCKYIGGIGQYTLPDIPDFGNNAAQRDIADNLTCPINIWSGRWWGHCHALRGVGYVAGEITAMKTACTPLRTLFNKGPEFEDSIQLQIDKVLLVESYEFVRISRI